MLIAKTAVALSGSARVRVTSADALAGLQDCCWSAGQRDGVIGKELQRQLGVTYKTAWRMGKHIRMLMDQADPAEMLLAGHVEIDETYVGGKRSGGKRGRGAPGKTIVMGFKERGGRMVATIIPDVKLRPSAAETIKNVEPGTTVSTDELMSYGLLAKEGYSHFAVSTARRNGAYMTTGPRLGTARTASRTSGTCSRTRSARRISTSARGHPGTRIACDADR